MNKPASQAVKSYTAPFWIMLFITLIKTFFLRALYNYVEDVGTIDHTHANNPLGNLFFFWVILFIIETLVYWIIRKKCLKKPFVWLHIVVVFTGFIILPVVTLIISLVADRMYPPRDFYTIYQSIMQVQFYLFWFLFIIGHALFITTIVKSFRKENRDNEAAPGILDGIVDEY